MPETPIDAKFAASLPVAAGVTVVKVASGIIALNKPEGVRAHPNQNGVADKGALVTVPFDAKRECYLLPSGESVYLLHRIDAPTSGILLLTLDAALAAKVKELFAAHEVHKTYEALVFGDAGKGTHTWRDRLRTERSERGARTTSGSGDAAVTLVRVVTQGKGSNGMPLSLLSMEPATGRTHQLRVQCSTRRLPIVGDATYGNFPSNRRAAKELGLKRLCLHAAAVRFEVEIKGRKVSFDAKCPAPEIFKTVFGS